MEKIPSAPAHQRQFRESLTFERLIAGGLLITVGSLCCVFATGNGPLTDHTVPMQSFLGSMLTILWHVVLGSILIVSGILTCVNRGRLTVDGASQTVLLRFGFPFPLFTRQWAFAELETVCLRHRGWNDAQNSQVHIIDLTTKDGGTIEVIESQDRLHDELAARRLAEDLSRIIKVDLVDELTYTKIRRHPDALDESLRDRMKREGTATYDAFPIPTSRCRVVNKPGEVMVRVPPPPFLTLPTVVLSAIGFAITAFVGLGVVPDLVHSRSESVPYMAACTAILYFVFMIPVLGPLIERARDALRWTTVTATPNGLSITRGLPLWKTTIFISSQELEELRLEELNWKVLTAISDKQVVRFGEGLTQDELIWIHDSLLNGLVA